MAQADPLSGLSSLKQLKSRLARLYAKRAALDSALASLKDYKQQRDRRLRGPKRKAE